MSPSNVFRTGGLAVLFSTLFTLLSAPPVYGQSDLHRAVPPPGRALIFVYRVDRDPAAGGIPVVLNREPAGELAHGSFIAATVSPGPAELRIGQRLVRTLTFTTAANQSYFVRVQALDAGTPVRIDAQSVSEPEGRRAIAQSRLVGVGPVVVIPSAVSPIVAATPEALAPEAPPQVAAPPPPVVVPPVTAPTPPPQPVAVPQPAPPVFAKPDTVTPAPAPEASAPVVPRRESAFALIASAGTFKLSEERQSVAGLPATFDTSSKSVFSLEAEWRSSSGFAVGGEFFTYENDLVTTAAISAAQQKVYAVMLNGKYYFHAADWLYPFVGIGVGQAHASYSGGLTGTATGLAYQGMAGLEIRFKPVGVYVQYKYLGADVGESGRDVKVGGRGILAGLSISF